MLEGIAAHRPVEARIPERQALREVAAESPLARRRRPPAELRRQIQADHPQARAGLGHHRAGAAAEVEAEALGGAQETGEDVHLGDALPVLGHRGRGRSLDRGAQRRPSIRMPSLRSSASAMTSGATRPSPRVHTSW